MADYCNAITRISENSDILRIYGGALVQIFTSGTNSLITEVVCDEYGNFAIPTLATGKYDVKVDGQLRFTFHHVKIDHTHIPDKQWQFFKSGAISGDQAEVNTMQVYGTGVAGFIIYAAVACENVGNTGDATVHILSGSVNGASALTIASNSIWNHRIYPQAARNRYFYEDLTPAISTIGAGQAITVGIDYTAGTVEGLTVLLIFRPS